MHSLMTAFDFLFLVESNTACCSLTLLAVLRAGRMNLEMITCPCQVGGIVQVYEHSKMGEDNVLDFPIEMYLGTIVKIAKDYMPVVMGAVIFDKVYCDGSAYYIWNDGYLFDDLAFILGALVTYWKKWRVEASMSVGSSPATKEMEDAIKENLKAYKSDHGEMKESYFRFKRMLDKKVYRKEATFRRFVDIWKELMKPHLKNREAGEDSDSDSSVSIEGMAALAAAAV